MEALYGKKINSSRKIERRIINIKVFDEIYSKTIGKKMLTK